MNKFMHLRLNSASIEFDRYAVHILHGNVVYIPQIDVFVAEHVILTPSYFLQNFSRIL